MNKKDRIQHPLRIVILLYGLCYIFRWFEYFFLQTDRTFLGEAIVHKGIGILILWISAAFFSISMKRIGFLSKGAWRNLGLGLLLGIVLFLIGYSVESMLIYVQENNASFQLYVSSYSVHGNIGHQTSIGFFLICMLGNIVNVWMEEGIFRGLFQTILQRKYTWLVSAILASLLFGFWHMIGPVRAYMEGTSSMGGMLANILMLVSTSALAGFTFAMLTKLTGSLYMAMGVHFVNNTIVNTLHVVTTTGSDEFLIVRMATAQTLSFLIILFVFLRKQKQTRISL